MFVCLDFMLETDPFKRPDIYQVSYLAFQLLQRPYPFKNIDVCIKKKNYKMFKNLNNSINFLIILEK